MNSDELLFIVPCDLYRFMTKKKNTMRQAAFVEKVSQPLNKVGGLVLGVQL